MKLRTSVFIAAALAALTAASVFAQVSAENRDWPKSPAGFLLTDEEQQRWKSVKTDAEAQNFINLFWARRDPTPSTPANEFRDEFNSRVEYADRNFGEGRKKGSLTERGKYFVILGAPTRLVRAAAANRGQVANPSSEAGMGAGGIAGASTKQLWVYEQPKTKLQLNAPEAEIPFVDQYGNNNWTMERGGRTDVAALSRRALQSYVVSPNLTVLPQAAPQQATSTPAIIPTSSPSSDSIGAFKTESLKTAVADVKAGKLAASKNVGLSFTEMLSPKGDFFVPVQIYIPKSVGVTADAVATFFGQVEDASGNVVAVFEEPAKLAASKGDLYFDRSLSLKPGTYKATFGLADASGKPVVISTQPLELKDLPKDSTGITRMVVSNDIHETEEAALVGAPYAFGRVKIVPKGDRVFSNKDEINYFIEVVNPGVDETTSLPKLQVKLDLIQTPVNGKGRTIPAPITDATPLPLTGTSGPGQYAILAGIPLGQMKNTLPAGEYTLRVKVYDQVRKENWTTEQKFNLIDAPPAQ